MEEFREVGLERYVALASLLCSRNFYCHNAPEDRLVVPLAGSTFFTVDMFNYHCEKKNQTYWCYVSAEQAFTIVAQKNISKGEVISVNYGTKCSSRYLHYYGFIPENNLHESVPISLKLHKDDPLLEEKQRMLETDTMELRKLEFAVSDCWPLNKNDKVMSYLRFIEYKGDPKALSNVTSYEEVVCDSEDEEGREAESSCY